MRIGYHASHEQFLPSELLRWVIQAEDAGFQSVLSSDHFFPWSDQQGQSGFAWSWLGAALQATRNIDFGIVNAPGQRYHPAIIAQACATLAEMYPERFWIAIGSGQNLNEHITGTRWPSKAERNMRLLECATILERLWAGETVTTQGLVVTEDARLYTLPAKKPMLLGAAVTEQTAEWIANWADGLITTSRPVDDLKRMRDKFIQGGGECKPIYIKVQLSYDRTEEEARGEALLQWRNNIFENDLMTELRTPAQFDAAGKCVDLHELEGKVLVSSSLQQHVDWLAEYIEAGFTNLLLHNVNRSQEVFIKDFGEKVLPALKSIV
ncbi:TIGR03885 family FMN-dependent LLM class oxidoreductase [Ohtaekwangia koreensis]|uniref:Probable non-F420 flavinoid oxidoreductase n=1 Tax=Ohtaekwangia koreensis TaxID=688867 RepID=A0A1T5MCN5_9BACT|nr:TIGR03885 family FMN-dependent LLM class oxidoreductase [Ohtaekwangia koreensis]SKC85980.1 probable non-F420 flavinoid oxidoreductase [Ohtaekwangia koreensis]